MNELLSKVAEVDPDFARSLRRNQVLSYVFAFVAVLAIGGAAWAVGVNFKQDTTITQIKRHSACETDPTGEECQTVKRESDEAQSIRDTCRSFWKVGYACPKPGSPEAEREIQANSKSIQDLDDGSGGRAAPGLAPAPGGLADSGPLSPAKPDGPRRDPPSEPGGSGPDEAPAGRAPAQGATPSPERSPGPPAEAPGKGPASETVEAAGGLIEKASGALNEGLCAARALLAPCPP